MPRDLFLTLLILGVLACTPVFFHFWRRYGPRDPHWRKLSDAFGTENRPRSGRLFEDRALRFHPAFYGQYHYVGARFDFRVSDEGLWLEFLGPDEAKCARRMCIPWKEIIFRKHQSDRSHFVLIAESEIDVFVDTEVGKAMADRTFRRYN